MSEIVEFPGLASAEEMCAKLPSDVEGAGRNGSIQHPAITVNLLCPTAQEVVIIDWNNPPCDQGIPQLIDRGLYSKLIAADDQSLHLLPLEELTDCIEEQAEFWAQYTGERFDSGPLAGERKYIGSHEISSRVSLGEKMHEAIQDAVGEIDEPSILIVSGGVVGGNDCPELRRVLEAAGIAKWRKDGNIDILKPNAKIFISEFTGETVEELTAVINKLEQSGLTPGMVKAIQWNLYNHSPFVPGSFDLVTSTLVHNYFPPEVQSAIWQEYNRIIRRDGYAIEGMFTELNLDKAARNLFGLLIILTSPATYKRAFRGYIGFAKKWATEFQRMQDAGYWKFLAKDDLIKQVKNSGFAVSMINRIGWIFNKATPTIVVSAKKVEEA